MRFIRRAYDMSSNAVHSFSYLFLLILSWFEIDDKDFERIHVFLFVVAIFLWLSWFHDIDIYGCWFFSGGFAGILD